MKTRFLAKTGEIDACGLFTKGHMILFFLTIISVIVALKKDISKDKEKILSIIRRTTIVMWGFEVLRILFKLWDGEICNLESCLPLYYCSILLYAGILSSFFKGFLKRMGDVFLATGGIVGGFIFLLFPTTSLPCYPAFHFISVHSFLFHGVMVYLGILLFKTDYIKLEINDIKLYAILVGTICVITLIINSFSGSNLMFISRAFPGVLGDAIYNFTGRLYTPLMILVHITLPFLLIYGLQQLKLRKYRKA